MEFGGGVKKRKSKETRKRDDPNKDLMDIKGHSTFGDGQTAEEFYESGKLRAKIEKDIMENARAIKETGKKK